MFLSKYVALVALAAGALGATNIAQAVSDMQAVTDGVNKAKDSLDNYNGGIAGALKVAHAIYNAHTASETARKSIGDSDPFSDEDGQKAMDAYNDIQPRIIETARVAQEKAPLFKKAGLGYVAQGMISNLYNEKNDFETEMKGKLSDSHYRSVQPSAEAVDEAFKDAVKAFKN